MAGLFLLVGVIVLFALSLGIAGYSFKGDRYNLFLEFSDVGGLKKGASVELAGVQIGEVEELTLKNSKAVVKVSIFNSVKLRDDDVFSVNTKGLIGDKFIKIVPGNSDTYLQPNSTVTETVDSMDIEGLISRIVGRFVENQK
ncbi:MAG: MlaD family protein [Deltaproteobacteria bacterium]|nr:MlaD family protein [Deltaproteobacteria bacterium]